MKLILTAPSLPDRQRRFAEQELEEAIPRIRKHLVTKDKQSRILRARISVDGPKEHPLYTVTLTVQMPDHPVVVQKKDHDLGGALGSCEATMKRDLKRVGAKIRKYHLRKRRTATRDSLAMFTEEISKTDGAAAAPTAAAEENPVFARLRPLMGQLYTYAREHLATAQIAGEVPIGYLVAEDLVDQAILRVIDKDSERLKDAGALERQLFRYIDHLITEEAERQHPADSEMVSIDGPAPDSNDHQGYGSPEREEVEFYQPFEALRLGDVLVDEHAVDPEHHMSDVEEHRLIQKYLAGFPTMARSAFLLNLIEGFELFEIAMIQNRDEDDVQGDIDTCTEKLKAEWERVVGAAMGP